MPKSSVICTLLVLLAAAAAFAVPLPGSAVPAVAAPAPAAASPSTPAKDPGKTELPSGDFTPKPNYVCQVGWCSSDIQCVQRYGAGSTCYLQPGATCGHCTL
jgi:hypothetical protein